MHLRTERRRKLVHLSEELMVFRETVHDVPVRERSPGLTRTRWDLIGLFVLPLVGSVAAVAAGLLLERRAFLVAGAVLFLVEVAVVARHGSVELTETTWPPEPPDPPVPPPRQAFLVRFERASRIVRRVGPVRERLDDDSFLRDVAVPEAETLPLGQATLAVGRHRLTPWSDADEDGAPPDGLTAKAIVDSPGPLGGEYDVLSGLADEGWAAASSPEAESRRRTAEALFRDA